MLRAVRCLLVPYGGIPFATIVIRIAAFEPRAFRANRRAQGLRRAVITLGIRILPIAINSCSAAPFGICKSDFGRAEL